MSDLNEKKKNNHVLILPVQFMWNVRYLQYTNVYFNMVHIDHISVTGAMTLYREGVPSAHVIYI